MNIQSVAQKDIRKLKTERGAYEWWYFDATSNDGATELVIIFYEGNPFSRRYIQHQLNDLPAKAEQFPAVSISIYQNQQPIYYSFTEVEQCRATFHSDSPGLQIGNHSMKFTSYDDALIYSFSLKETLPSGDAIDAELTFKSPSSVTGRLNIPGNDTTGHAWHLIQPRAKVEGWIACKLANNEQVNIDFTGEGYHDHNIGREPLKRKFDEWYWGRFHFRDALLIYYLTAEENDTSRRGWLLDRTGYHVQHVMDDVSVSDYSSTLYGLKTGRKIRLQNDQVKIIIQQTHLLDNGPFYQRFSSDAFLTIPSQNIAASSRGISEYLCPPKIYNRLFWPLTNMRIRYKKEPPHWVQRSGRLYRWTW